MQFEPNVEGIFEIPAQVYFDAPGWSNSASQHIDPPARYPEYLLKKEEPTDDMIIGTLVHDMTLEPGKPPKRVIIEPAKFPAPADHAQVKQGKVSAGDPIDWHNGSKYCKAWHEQKIKEGSIVLKQDKYDTMLGCAEAILNRPSAAEIIKASRCELSAFAKLDGVLCKCRIDILPPTEFIADLKTGLEYSADKDVWKKRVRDMEYFTQAGSYLDIWNAIGDSKRDKWVHIVVEKAPPFLVSIFPLDKVDIELGSKLARKRRLLYKRCVETKTWPGYTTKPVAVSLDEWDRRKIQEQIDSYGN